MARERGRGVIVSMSRAEAEALAQVAKQGLWPRVEKRALMRIVAALEFVKAQQGDTSR